MFSAERRAIATLFAEYAGQGLRGAGLIAHVRDERSDATWQDGEHLRVKLAGVVGEPLPQKMTMLLAELRRRTDRKSIR